jgi:fatty-acyl-CoA synthase
MLHRAARWFPANEAVVDELHRLTYSELLDRSRRFATLLHRLGVRKGDRVALMLYPSAVHCVALFGAVELGAIPVALHVRESHQVLGRVLQRLGPTALVYDAAVEPLAQRLVGETRTIAAVVRARSAASSGEEARGAADVRVDATIPQDIGRYEPDLPVMPAREDDPAVIVLSSGTTSLPKGIVHTHRTLVESARGGAYFWNGIRPTDSILNVLTTSFIGWYNLSLPFFNVGAKNVFLSKWDPKTYLETMEREGITAAFLIPTMWRLLIKEGAAGYDLSAVKMAGFAGEVMDPTTLQHIREQITPHVINVYGTTETGSCSGGTLLWEEDILADERRLASVGKPLLNADIRVIRLGGTVREEVPPGEQGEVVISGPSVASLVWDDPAKTEEIFEFDGANTWWHSGDAGYLDEDGYLYLEGRLDDMIISGGINILPARVEDAVLAHDDVVECAVVGVPHPEWGQQVAAYVVAKNPALTEADLDAFLRQSELSDYQRPRRYVFAETMPRTSSGKLNRRALRHQAQQEAAADA